MARVIFPRLLKVGRALAEKSYISLQGSISRAFYRARQCSGCHGAIRSRIQRAWMEPHKWNGVHMTQTGNAQGFRLQGRNRMFAGPGQFFIGTKAFLFLESVKLERFSHRWYEVRFELVTFHSSIKSSSRRNLWFPWMVVNFYSTSLYSRLVFLLCQSIQ